MKKYTKPTVEVVELSVKESLSALPNGVRVGRPAIANTKLAYVATMHTMKQSGGSGTLVTK